jgi:hypothetical protein
LFRARAKGGDLKNDRRLGSLQLVGAIDSESFRELTAIARAVEVNSPSLIEIQTQPRFFLSDNKKSMTPIIARTMAMVKPVDDIAARE